MADTNVPFGTLTKGPVATPRDYMADILRHFGMDTHRAERLSTNTIGNDRESGLLDLTPLGVPEAARRSTSALGKGNLVEAIAEGVGIVPGIGPALRKVGKGITSTLNKFPGEKIKTVQLRGGHDPLFGIVDEADNSLCMTFGGSESERGVHTILHTAIPDESEVLELMDQGIINRNQMADTIMGPRLFGGFGASRPGQALRTGPSPGEVDSLLGRGLTPGNAVKSGMVTGSNSRKNILDAIGAASRTKGLQGNTGQFFGHRVTGAKQDLAAANSGQGISIPFARDRAIKRGIKPAEDRTDPLLDELVEEQKRRSTQRAARREQRRRAQVAREVEELDLETEARREAERLTRQRVARDRLWEPDHINDEGFNNVSAGELSDEIPF